MNSSMAFRNFIVCGLGGSIATGGSVLGELRFRGLFCPVNLYFHVSVLLLPGSLLLGLLLYLLVHHLDHVSPVRHHMRGETLLRVRGQLPVTVGLLELGVFRDVELMVVEGVDRQRVNLAFDKEAVFAVAE